MTLWAAGRESRCTMPPWTSRSHCPFTTPVWTSGRRASPSATRAIRTWTTTPSIPFESAAYDPSTAIRPQMTMPARPYLQKPCDHKSAKSTTSKKFVTLRVNPLTVLLPAREALGQQDFESIQGEVGQRRRDDAALWRARLGGEPVRPFEVSGLQATRYFAVAGPNSSFEDCTVLYSSLRSGRGNLLRISASAFLSRSRSPGR